MSFKKTLEEFKAFAVKGNVVDMAVGVIIGGAFGKIVTSLVNFTAIVTSLVNDIINPIIGVVTGGLDFSSLFIALDGNHYDTIDAAVSANAAILKYGSFISAIINFLIVAFVIFILIKQLSKLKKKEAPVETAPTTKVCPYCKSEINIEATRCPHCTSEL